MDYNEFAEKIKAKYPDYNDMDNYELAQKMVAKYPDDYSDVTFDSPQNTEADNLIAQKQDVLAQADNALQTGQEALDIADNALNNSPVLKGGVSKTNWLGNLGKGLLQGVSSLGVGLGKNVVNKKIRPMLGKEPLSDQKLDEVYGFLDDKPQGISGNIGKFAGEFAPALLLPQTNIAKLGNLGNLALSGGYQAATIGGLNQLANEGKINPTSLAVETATGVALPLGMYGGGKAAETIARPLWNFAAQKLGRLTPETIAQAVKPSSKALDLDENQAQQLLLDTTQKVRSNYADLLDKKGREVGELLDTLPKDVNFKAQDLSNDMDKILSSYSLSGNMELNPAVNAFRKQGQMVDDLLYGNSTERMNKFKNSIDDLKFADKNKTVTRYGGNGHFATTVDSPETQLNNYLIQAERDTNNLLNGIKGKVAENPDILSNETYISKLENNMGNILKNIPLEAQTPYYEKLYEAVGKGNILDKSNMTRSPLELYDINKNISGMTNWAAKTDNEKLSNEVLRRLYGTYADRISSLNPELAKANKVYSDLMDFKNNDAVNQVLRGDLLNEGVIGAAPTALKNYRANITSGNKAKNIYDLENILYNNGYGTFTDKIDDINAAQNLINAATTGDSMITNAAKALLLRPALKTARWANQNGLPQKASNVYNNIQNNLAKYLLGGYEAAQE